MIRTGRVVEAKGGSLKVCFDRPEMCASCGKCGAHGVHQELVTVQGEADVGNWVQVEMPDAQIVKVSLIAYVIPLVFLMAGLVIGQNILGTDAWAAGLGIGLMAVGLLIVRLGPPGACPAGCSRPSFPRSPRKRPVPCTSARSTWTNRASWPPATASPASPA